MNKDLCIWSDLVSSLDDQFSALDYTPWLSPKCILGISALSLKQWIEHLAKTTIIAL